MWIVTYYNKLLITKKADGLLVDDLNRAAKTVFKEFELP